MRPTCEASTLELETTCGVNFDFNSCVGNSFNVFNDSLLLVVVEFELVLLSGDLALDENLYSNIS